MLLIEINKKEKKKETDFISLCTFVPLWSHNSYFKNLFHVIPENIVLCNSHLLPAE